MKSILMVDDVTTNLICAAEVLRTSYNVSTAKSGRQALLMLQEMTPDLIMLDVNMPRMDGYEVFEKLQENPVWAKIPVVFLTAESEMSQEIKGLEMGAMDFIRKPFDPEVMKARIEKILNLTDQKNRLEDEASMDPLTKLSNRKTMEDYVAANPSAENGYFLMIDLDNFKQVNDNYGHIVGDSVLVKVAEVFEQIMDHKGLVSRMGGDEFIIFLSGEFTRDEVVNLVRRLIATSEFEISEILADYSEFKVSISVGISCRPSDGNDFASLYANADKALYFVKQNGKRGFHFYDTVVNNPDHFDEENSRINLLQLQRLISENDDKDGAYKVEYEGFKRIYRFVSRCMDRKNQDVQIVLFTLENIAGMNSEALNDHIEALGEEVSLSLRRGDVATRCGDSQYVVILMDANEENGCKVAERIIEKYKDKHAGDTDISYEIETVKKGE